MSRTYHKKKKDKWTNGSCPYCRDNRKIRTLREEERSKIEMGEVK